MVLDVHTLVEFELLSPSSHLPDEDPDQPQPSGQDSHDAVEHELPETVSTLLDYHEHTHLLTETEKYKEVIAFATEEILLSTSIIRRDFSAIIRNLDGKS